MRFELKIAVINIMQEGDDRIELRVENDTLFIRNYIDLTNVDEVFGWEIVLSLQGAEFGFSKRELSHVSLIPEKQQAQMEAV